MMNAVKKNLRLQAGVFLMTVLCLVAAENAFALPEAGHVAVQNQYIWGMTTESGRAIHSRIIDKVPWRDNVGGFDHRKLWGHSEEWFYKGRIPKAEALENIKANLRKQNTALSGRRLEAEAQKVFKEAVSKTGQERIAEALRSEAPSLTKKESMAMAEQLYASHLIGDSTTTEGMRDMSEELKQKMMEIVSHPSPEALSAYNKLAVAEAMRQQGETFSTAAFSRQQQNFVRLKAEQYAQRGFKIYNPANRNYIGITAKGQNYILRMNSNNLRNIIEKMPGEKFLLPDDECVKFFKNGKNADIADKVLPMSKVTGETKTLAQQLDEIQSFADQKATAIKASEEGRLASMTKRLKTISPYAMAGGLMALSENWETLTNAWDGKTTWAKALTRTGVDFAGYTAIPYVVDGVLTQIGGNSVIVTSLKNAGMGYTLGFFIWNAGKEYLAYRIGDVSQEDFVNRMKQRGAQAGGELVSVLLLSLIPNTAGEAAGATSAVTAGTTLTLGTFVVPLVIVGSSFVIQRVQNWYEDKIWRETIYLDDVKAMLGEDLINEFTLMTPETRSSLAEPERRANLAEPEERHSLTNPEKRQSIIGY